MTQIVFAQNSYTQSILTKAKQKSDSNQWIQARGVIACAGLSALLDAARELFSLTRNSASLASGKLVQLIPLRSCQQWGKHLVKGLSESQLQKSAWTTVEMLIGGQRLAFQGVYNPVTVTSKKVHGLCVTLTNGPRGRIGRAVDMATSKKALVTYTILGFASAAAAGYYSMPTVTVQPTCPKPSLQDVSNQQSPLDENCAFKDIQQSQKINSDGLSYWNTSSTENSADASLEEQCLSNEASTTENAINTIFTLSPNSKPGGQVALIESGK